MESSRFKSFAAEEGIKATRQRAEILDIFLNSSGHKNLAQIHAQVTKLNPRIGYTTVYRTLKLLTRLGLAAQRKFADGETRYEPTREGAHHDHLICLDCGKIVEFKDDGIESLQQRVAKQQGFKIFHHRMELYGKCGPCSQRKGSPRKKG